MWLRGFWTNDRGGVAILVALSAIVLFGFVALVIDLGHALVTRNQLQNIADAAALEGTRQLGRIYVGLPAGQHATYTLSALDRNDILNRVNAVAQSNLAAGLSITIVSGDMNIGQWDMTTRSLTVTDTAPNAVQVVARRDGAANGPISTFFARIIGHDTVNVTARAAAALDGASEVVEGVLELPIGIGKRRFEDPNYCSSPIQFSPTGSYEGCASWNTFNQWPANSANLKKILKGLTDGSYTAPAVETGVPADPTPHPPLDSNGEPACCTYIGGEVASEFPELQALFEEHKEWNSDKGRWELNTTIVVYDRDTCDTNPSGYIPTYGFAKATVLEVLGPPDKIINAEIKCDEIIDARGGGPNLGTFASIPKLVQ